MRQLDPAIPLLTIALICGALTIALATVAVRGPAAPVVVRCVCEGRP